MRKKLLLLALAFPICILGALAFKTIMYNVNCQSHLNKAIVAQTSEEFQNEISEVIIYFEEMHMDTYPMYTEYYIKLTTAFNEVETLDNVDCESVNIKTLQTIQNELPTKFEGMLFYPDNIAWPIGIGAGFVIMLILLWIRNKYF